MVLAYLAFSIPKLTPTGDEKVINSHSHSSHNPITSMLCTLPGPNRQVSKAKVTCDKLKTDSINVVPIYIYIRPMIFIVGSSITKRTINPSLSIPGYPGVFKKIHLMHAILSFITFIIPVRFICMYQYCTRLSRWVKTYH